VRSSALSADDARLRGRVERVEDGVDVGWAVGDVGEIRRFAVAQRDVDALRLELAAIAALRRRWRWLIRTSVLRSGSTRGLSRLRSKPVLSRSSPAATAPSRSASSMAWHKACRCAAFCTSTPTSI
jgi:hypothetical protein